MADFHGGAVPLTLRRFAAQWADGTRRVPATLPASRPLHHLPALGQRGEKHPPVGLRPHPRIENHDDAPVAAGANQAAETLLELQDRLGQLIVAKRIAARGADRVQAGLQAAAGRER